MSALVHCDGPGCDETCDVGEMTRRMSQRPWLRLEQGENTQRLDFHSAECLAAWTAAQGPTTVEVQEPALPPPGPPNPPRDPRDRPRG